MTALSEAISQSAQWLIDSGDLVDGIKVSRDQRLRISASLLHLSMEHHGGIHTLVAHSLHGSALALLRPQLEAYIRGAWFWNCAEAEQIEAFKAHEEPPKINNMIRDLEALPAYEENMLSEIKRNAWSVLCGYTHGGFSQVINRNTDTEITNDYSEESIADLLGQSSTLTLLTLAAFASIINDEELANNALSKYDAIFNTGLQNPD